MGTKRENETRDFVNDRPRCYLFFDCSRDEIPECTILQVEDLRNDNDNAS